MITSKQYEGQVQNSQCFLTLVRDAILAKKIMLDVVLSHKIVNTILKELLLDIIRQNTKDKMKPASEEELVKVSNDVWDYL